jgi:hypothetical protein
VGLREQEQDTEVLRLTSKTSASVVAADGSQLNTTLLVGLGLSSSKSVNSTSVALKLFALCQFGIRTGILQLQPHVDVDNIFIILSKFARLTRLTSARLQQYPGLKSLRSEI